MEYKPLFNKFYLFHILVKIHLIWYKSLKHISLTRTVKELQFKQFDKKTNMLYANSQRVYWDWIVKNVICSAEVCLSLHQK